MGCISSKRAAGDPPASRQGKLKRPNLQQGSRYPDQNSNPHCSSPTTLSPAGPLNFSPSKKRKEGEKGGTTATSTDHDDERGWENGKKLKSSNDKSPCSDYSLGAKPGPPIGAEQCTAGWPGWLSAVAGEAIHGWLPLPAESFEKLEKVGQGTYSSVFKARELATGKIVALKKVRFDNLHPESVRFMAREITILRRLDHPNIIKLHGLITSRQSCSIYLVFDYMEHDLAGLVSSPEVHFTESHIKCFMQQLLYGLEYCHRRGVMHRDIKTSNILLNNDGVLKIADFGLANFISARYRQPLTSRVVTLWYRPPELLLGSTNYGAYVDLWSVGCVFSELLVGKVILKGKTEVEQLHKIFKLCGSPKDEFWTKSKLPHATMFKPQAPYESSLRERFKGFPELAVKLLETFLSIDPQDRGTAASSLSSEYFTTMPYACDPSSLPKYPPHKEIDSKTREEQTTRRKTERVRDSTSSRVPRRHKGWPQPSSVSMLGRPMDEPPINRKYARRNGTNNLVNRVKRADDLAYDMKSDISGVSQGESILMGSVGFTWANNKKHDSMLGAIQQEEEEEEFEDSSSDDDVSEEHKKRSNSSHKKHE